MMNDPRLDELDERWEVRIGDGPVLATAVHAGHALRDEVAKRSALSGAERLREEDPMTDYVASVGDHVFVPRVSRFEVDLNRPPHEAVYRTPDDAWGLDLWSTPLPDTVVDTSLRAHDRFYRLMGRWIEGLIETNGRVLLLDVHSFNHRRGGPGSEPLPNEENPELDLGVTTADLDRFGEVVSTLQERLRTTRIDGRSLDVRRNVRFPDGGNWPEWVFANYGDHVCTITLEYKKFFMDEWTGTADIAVLERLRRGLADAVASVRPLLA